MKQHARLMLAFQPAHNLFLSQSNFFDSLCSVSVKSSLCMVTITPPDTEFGIPVVTDIDEHVFTNVPDDTDTLRALLATSGLLCLRTKRKLELSQFESLTEWFGPIKDPVGRTRDGGTFRYSDRLQHIDAGYVLTDQDREKFANLNHGGLDDQRPGLFETFHCDDTYTEQPAYLTVLHARALPASGGGPTLFMDMRAAYDLLTDAEKLEIQGLQVLYAYNNDNAFPPRRAATGIAECLIEVTHPLVRNHHITDRSAIYMDLDRAKHIVGMPVGAGRRLLQKLQDHAEAAAPRCQHDWQPGDVLIWDNTSVQHKASGDFKLGEERRFWRHMVAAPQP